MPPTFTFNEQVALQVLQSMQRVNAEIRSELNELESFCEARLAEWDGSAVEAYKVHKAAWNQAAAQMPEALQRAATALANITEGYTASDQFAARLWQN